MSFVMRFLSAAMFGCAFVDANFIHDIQGGIYCVLVAILFEMWARRKP